MADIQKNRRKKKSKENEFLIQGGHSCSSSGDCKDHRGIVQDSADEYYRRRGKWFSRICI